MSAEQLQTIRAMLVATFAAEDDDFGEADWEHALGGMHFLVDAKGEVRAHASVVQREVRVGGVPLRCGYVEAVATAPAHQGRGLGTRVMAEVCAYIADQFQLGALGTGRHGFYERLRWQTWRGTAWVRTSDGELRTPDEEGFIMVLTTPTTPAIDLRDPISCDWRPGDAW